MFERSLLCLKEVTVSDTLEKYVEFQTNVSHITVFSKISIVVFLANTLPFMSIYQQANGQYVEMTIHLDMPPLFFTHCNLFSGKSNLMDAISFVLGEKTGNLRVKRLSVCFFIALL